MTPAIDSPGALALFLVAATPSARAQAPTASPTVETAPVPSSGDAADDIAVWVHPVQPAASLVIGTDKQSGLAVHDLGGNRLQFLADGRLNNVDVRAGFELAGSEVALVTSGERDGDRLAVYSVDPGTRSLRPVAARVIALGIDVYGCCMYRSAWTGDTYFFCTSEGGLVQQWRLFPAGSLVDAELVRSFDVGSTSEGCVADDDHAYLFVAEEGVGIWRYGAEPGAGSARTPVDTTVGGHLASDVEGLALYDAPGGAGYLIASSQGNDSFVVYERRPPHEHRLTFRVASNPALGIDEVSGTDGIEVTSSGLGSAFPRGFFAAQDSSNPGANQNFKLVPWEAIAVLADPPLIGADAAPRAAFSASASPANPRRITFTDLSTGEVTAWHWDFGDGATASEQHPVHVYAAAGSYTIELTVSGPAGSDSTEKVVEVGPGESGDGGGGGGGCSIAPGGSGRPHGGDPSLALVLALVLAAHLRRARLAGGLARTSGGAPAF